MPPVDASTRPTPPSSAGVVVIGRNEGTRLLACLRDLLQQHRPLIYVDSGSSDASVALAAGRGVAVHRLDPARPFSAARARNEGFVSLRERHPELGLVQFIDADCTLLAGWLDGAAAAMVADDRLAVVVGQLVERAPEASIYNRLCALEWASPAGELRDPGALGGIMLVRAAVFAALGGFREQVIAGEDSEFGVRCALAGHRLAKLALPMATHDADIRSFGQWWRRAVRSGHAIGQRAQLNGRTRMRDCVRERRSALAWGAALPALALLLAPASGGASLGIVGALYGVLVARVYRHRRGRGDGARDAWLYARHIALGKFAQAWGLATFHANVRRGQFRLIEYK
jgi:GT2 family glycosyltransferase